MTKPEIIIFIFFSVSFTGCQNKPAKRNIEYEGALTSNINQLIYVDSNHVVLNIPDDFTTLKIDDVVKEMKYIKLETSKESLVGQIDKIIFHKDQLYILDRSYSKSIHIFDLKGKYISTISKQGKGPEEYVTARDFDFSNDKLVIYDDLGGKIMFFSPEGKFLSTVKTSFRFRSFSSFYNDKFLYVTRNADNSHIKEINNFSLLVGSLDSISYKGFENNSLQQTLRKTMRNPLSFFNHTFSYAPLLSNDIYQINEDGSSTLRYRLNFERTLPPDYASKTTSADFDDFVKQGKYTYFMGRFSENSEHLFVRFNPPSESYAYSIYNKEKKELIAYDAYKPPGNYLGFASPIAIYKDYFVSSLNPADVLRSKNREDVKKVLNEISEDDNPIIILYKLK